MKRAPHPAFLLSGIFFVLATWVPAQAPATLSMLEQDSLAREAKTMLVAGTTGDAEVIIKRTHPVILKFYPSREHFEQSTRSVLKDLKGSMTFEELAVGEISPLYPHGTDEICLVPTTFVSTFRGKRARNHGFLFAIREKGKGQWRFLDGAFLRRDGSLLWRVFPDFPKDNVLPPNRVEMLP